jgi:chalcone isomerase-like protein
MRLLGNAATFLACAVFAASAFVACGAALAVEAAGVKLNDKVNIAGNDLVLNGAGVRTRVVFKVYVASLYLPKKASDLQGVLAQQPRHIELDMLRTLTADQLVDALNEGLEANNTPAEMAAIKAQTDQLAATMYAFKEVKEGDVVTLDFVDGGTRVGLNGQPKGVIAGDAFNAALTKVWLGDKPVQADLKKALLGG